MSKLTHKDIKSHSIYLQGVEFTMKDGTVVFVNLEDQTVINDLEETITGDDYEYFIQAAADLFAENEENELFDKYGTQCKETGERVLDRKAIARDRQNEFLADYK